MRSRSLMRNCHFLNSDAPKCQSVFSRKMSLNVNSEDTDWLMRIFSREQPVISTNLGKPLEQSCLTYSPHTSNLKTASPYYFYLTRSLSALISDYGRHKCVTLGEHVTELPETAY
ncbi:uncharacterized protein LOC116427590 [Nomia melanderi]|uniref:uncharacterized protein LOC116427590 n=1 Tax=Nomia melanderi TaxID=2448451 RepID=UPI003FCE1F37